MKIHMKRSLLGALLILLLCSHDMYLKMDSYFLQAHTESVIHLFNGTFDKSDNEISRDRMLDVSLVGNGNRQAVDTTDWFEKNNTTFLRFTTGDEGTWVAGVSTRPRNIEMTAEDFNGYLEHDGVLDELARRKDTETLQDDAVERYSKHVKTIFQVGDRLSEDWKTVLDYPIEFVPQDNPYDLHPGHSLRVQLLRDGEPLPSQLVYVGYQPDVHSHSDGEHTHADGTRHSHENEGEHTHEDGDSHTHVSQDQEHTHEDGTTHTHANDDEGHSHAGNSESHTHESQDQEHTHEDGTTHTHANDDKGHSHDKMDADEGSEEEGHTHEGTLQLRTDGNGMVEVDISATGVWYLRTIHLVPSEELGLTHESNWATLTFAVGEGHSHSHDGDTHTHEDAGLPSYVYWIGSIVLVVILFFWFNRKK